MYPTEFFRLDPLTGCNSFLSFIETLDQLASLEEKLSFSILFADLNYTSILNETRGRTYGDSALRWLAIVLREETNTPTYRIGGDEFVVILISENHANHEKILRRMFERLNSEGEQLGIPIPAASISLIHYEHDADISVSNVLFQMAEATLDTKTRKARTTNILLAKDLTWAEENSSDHSNRANRSLRWIADSAIEHVLNLSRMLDEAQRTSHLDPISGLPNIRAASLKLEKVLNEATVSSQPFSLLLIDGDNIRRYNSINYAAGDEMIQNMGVVLSENLRPGDFIARWRTGDEFIVILPDTDSESARVIGERLCFAIRDASKTWKFPTTISIGVSVYPIHGTVTNALIDMVEFANKRAKDEGKDRVVVAE